jgi:hypothetical protein
MSENFPESLPTLARGNHKDGDGQACVMEYVSILAGEQFSDHPSCTNSVLAAAARSVNDWMTDDGRHLLVPLIGRLFGTASRGSEDVDIQMAQFVNAYVHEVIDTVTGKDPDAVLAAYLTALLDKFDELTGYNSEDTRDLTEAELAVLHLGVTLGKTDRTILDSAQERLLKASGSK